MAGSPDLANVGRFAYIQIMNEQSAGAAGAVPEVTLAWRLRIALAHAGMTTADIADEIGVTRQTVTRWLNEDSAAMRRAYITQWAFATGVDRDWLATGETQEGRARRDSNPQPSDLESAALVIDLLAYRSHHHQPLGPCGPCDPQPQADVGALAWPIAEVGAIDEEAAS